MDKLLGLACIMLAVYGFTNLESCSEKRNREQQIVLHDLAREQAQSQMQDNIVVPHIDGRGISDNQDLRCKTFSPMFDALRQKYCSAVPVADMCAVWKKEPNPQMCLGDTRGELCLPSSAGAQGIIQTMPATGITWGKDADGCGRYNPQSLEDAMATYLAYRCHLMQKVPEKDIHKAYFAGPGGVNNTSPKWAPKIAEYDRLMRSYSEHFTGVLSGTIAVGTTMIASNATPSTTLATTATVAHLTDSPINVKIFPAVPIDGFLDWFSASGNERVRQRNTKDEHIVPHQGVDLGKDGAVPVKSVCAGRVEFASELSDGLGGNTVMVVCDNTRSSHMHLATIRVRVGQTVQANEVVGINGNTGSAKGGKTHDHFKLEYRNSSGEWHTVNPCAGEPGGYALNCAAMFGPKTSFAPLKPVDSQAVAIN